MVEVSLLSSFQSLSLKISNQLTQKVSHTIRKNLQKLNIGSYLFKPRNLRHLRKHISSEISFSHFSVLKIRRRQLWAVSAALSRIFIFLELPQNNFSIRNHVNLTAENSLIILSAALSRIFIFLELPQNNFSIRNNVNLTAENSPIIVSAALSRIFILLEKKKQNNMESFF